MPEQAKSQASYPARLCCRVQAQRMAYLLQSSLPFAQKLSIPFHEEYPDMTGLQNRMAFLALKLLVLLSVAALFGGMGGGDEKLTGGLPLPEKNFVVQMTDRTGLQTQSTKLTWDGKVHFRGKYGEATVNVPFAKIKRVDFSPANTGASAYTIATVSLHSGQQLELALENQTNIYAETPFGELEISVADLRQLEFSE